MEVYAEKYEVEMKTDFSPLTVADRLSHTIIARHLADEFPHIPIISEEGQDVPYVVRKGWKKFWLVDPLDGTKEFINKNGEFTINIALIEEHYPSFGMIYVPVMDTIYYGYPGEAVKIDSRGRKESLRVNRNKDSKITLVESRTHPSFELLEFKKKIESKYHGIDAIEKGSSLKFCTIAEGQADIYPRFGPTMEWDTAAGQAILESAGGYVLDLEGGRFSYNKESLVNGPFIAANFKEEF